MKNYTKEIQLPSFHGFYGSVWSADEWDGYELKERGIELIDEWQISENYFTDVARAYTEEIEQMYREYLGVDIRLRFTELSSPSFYNYTTDKIYCELSCEDGEKFEKRIIELVRENYSELAEYVRKNHSSREGFISFMSNNIDDWIYEFMESELVLSCLLYYLLDKEFRAVFDEDFEWHIHERLYCNGFCPECYAEPETDAAIEELERIELKEAQDEALRKYQYKLAFPNF